MVAPDSNKDAAKLIEVLTVALATADRCGFHQAAIHIDADIIALGGSGTVPPSDV